MKNSKLRLILIWGIVVGILTSIPTYLAYFININWLEKGETATINLLAFTIVPLVAGIVLAIFQKRNNGGKLSFGDAMVFIVGTVSIAVITNAILYGLPFIFDSAFVSAYAKLKYASLENQVKTGQLTKQSFAQYNEVLKNTTFSSMLFAQVILFDIELIFCSGIIGLIIASIIRKEK